jgi:hypothetical protein
MARTMRITVRNRGPDYGTRIAVLVMIGFIVASAFGFVPSWVQ